MTEPLSKLKAPKRVRLSAPKTRLPVNCWPYIGEVGLVRGWCDNGYLVEVEFSDCVQFVAASHLCAVE